MAQVKILIATIAVSFLSDGAIRAQDLHEPWGDQKNKWNVDSWTLQVDNDLFANTDRDYTSGVRLAFGGPITSAQEFGPLRGKLHKLSGDGSDYKVFDQLSQFRENREYRWGTGFTQLQFTPDSSLPRTPPPGERPYAAWLGADVSIHVRDDKSFSTVALSIGVTGEWALGEETQDILHHDITRAPLFNGWDSQLPEEVTVNLHLDHKRKMGFLDSAYIGNFGFDGYYEFGGSAGTMRTAAYVGGLIRGGWNLPNDYSVPRLQIASQSSEFFTGHDHDKGQFSAYILCGLRGSAVLHDITLDGSLFQDWNFSVNSKPFIGELIFGAGMGFGDWELVYSRTIRTNEFEDQIDNQDFGSILIRWRKPF